ncbi:hypothetical protein HGQ98_28210, partial [Achromobacter ruhlandii]|nr:hypothetical protein [Achromobacter ruhlandii]
MAVAVVRGSWRCVERGVGGADRGRASGRLRTTISEAGSGVPSANTIVIHGADRCGLAQLHQLR